MDNSKKFLRHNMQMKYLRENKKIECSGSEGKKILIKYGYFNLINMIFHNVNLTS